MIQRKNRVVIQETDRRRRLNFPAKRLNYPKHPMMPRQSLHPAVTGVLISD